MPQQEYEYQIAVLDRTESDPENMKLDGIENRLNRLAKQGYRLVGVRQGVQHGLTYAYALAIMERPFVPRREEDAEEQAATTADDDVPVRVKRAAYEWGDDDGADGKEAEH